MLSDADAQWLKAHQPELEQVEDGIVKGVIHFAASLVSGQLVIDPDPASLVKADYARNYRTDSYEVEINWNGPQPKLKEIGGRIRAAAIRHRKEPRDLHINDDGTACVAADQDLEVSRRAGLTLPLYIESYVVPFLYGESYFEDSGTWPWNELSHGPWGLLDWLGRKPQITSRDVADTLRDLRRRIGDAETKRLISQRCRGHRPCPCGSGRKARNCHPYVKTAIARIRSELNG